MWQTILKEKTESDLSNWMGLILSEGYFVDQIYMKDKDFPLGRPWDTLTGRYRIFWDDNENTWTEEQEKAGTPKGPNNPYYAPATHPDEYTDFKVTEDNDLEFIAGNRKFWNKVYRWYNGN